MTESLIDFGSEVVSDKDLAEYQEQLYLRDNLPLISVLIFGNQEQIEYLYLSIDECASMTSDIEGRIDFEFDLNTQNDSFVAVIQYCNDQEMNFFVAGISSDDDLGFILR